MSFSKLQPTSKINEEDETDVSFVGILEQLAPLISGISGGKATKNGEIIGGGERGMIGNEIVQAITGSAPKQSVSIELPMPKIDTTKNQVQQSTSIPNAVSASSPVSNQAVAPSIPSFKAPTSVSNFLKAVEVKSHGKIKCKTDNRGRVT